MSDIEKKREDMIVGILPCIRTCVQDPTGYTPEDCASDIMAVFDFKGVEVKVKCPDCAWSQFGEEAVGMTPCYSCNSTGYIIEPLIDTPLTSVVYLK